MRQVLMGPKQQGNSPTNDQLEYKVVDIETKKLKYELLIIAKWMLLEEKDSEGSSMILGLQPLWTLLDIKISKSLTIVTLDEIPQLGSNTSK